MLRSSVVLSAAILLAGLSASPVRAASEGYSCQTLNDQTICIRNSGGGTSLSCTSTNGNTVCVGNDGLRCETVNGRLTCRGGRSSEVQVFGPKPRAETPPPPMLDEDDDDEAETVAPPPPSRALPRTAPLRRGPTISIERKSGALRVRTEGGIDLRID